MEKLGFIGMGNMAQALAAGFINAGAIAKEKVYAFAPNQEKLAKNAAAIGFTAVKTVQELADTCDTLVMACKPYQIESVLTELGDKLKGKALISIAAGWDFADLLAALEDYRLIALLGKRKSAEHSRGTEACDDNSAVCFNSVDFHIRIQCCHIYNIILISVNLISIGCINTIDVGINRKF